MGNKRLLGPVLKTWGRTLVGKVPTLSIEITRECPLRCPGCYAYEDNHLGAAGVNLRSLADYKGEELVRRVLALVDEHQPLHLSIVGGDPLVRYRELEVLLPRLTARGIFVQLVTSAFRVIPREWASLPNMLVVVSIDGLQPEHDERRKPATYDRILENIAGQHIVAHCTITSFMMRRPGYLEEFVALWSANADVARIWMSIFTPQRAAHPAECLSEEQRRHAIDDLLRLRLKYPKLDTPEVMLREFLTPPKSPDKCIFALTTRTFSADLKTRVEPCQLGGDPDCARCGCIASMVLAAVGNKKLVGPLTAGHLFFASHAVGRKVNKLRDLIRPAPVSAPRPEPLVVLKDQHSGD